MLQSIEYCQWILVCISMLKLVTLTWKKCNLYCYTNEWIVIFHAGDFLLWSEYERISWLDLDHSGFRIFNNSKTVRRLLNQNYEAPCARLSWRNVPCWAQLSGRSETDRVLLSLSVFEGELSETIPVVHASIAGCRIIGRMCVGECSNQTHTPTEIQTRTQTEI